MVTTNIINLLSNDYDITVVSNAEIIENIYEFNKNVKVVSLGVPNDLCRIDYFAKKYWDEHKFGKLLTLPFRIAYYYTIGRFKKRKKLLDMTTKDDLIIASSADCFFLTSKKRTVAYHYHFNAKYFFGFSNYLLWKLVIKPDYFFFLTKTTYDTVMQRKPKAMKKESFYIYNPVRIEPKLNLKTNHNHLVFLGRYMHQKNPMLAMRVALELKKASFPFTLDMYGGGNFYKEMLAFKEEHDLVEVTVHSMTNDVRGVLQDADLLLVTSVFEGHSLVIVEANSQSVPAITSNWGDACNEIVIEGVNGYIIGSNKPQDYANKIMDVLNNEEELLKLKKSSYESSFRFSSDEIRNSWLDVLKKIESDINLEVKKDH